MPPDPHFYPCVIYIRVSTEEQAKEEHYSLRSQEEYCLAEIKKHEGDGWFFLKTISDAGLSGDSPTRPGLLHLLDLVRTGQVRIVVVYRRDRLFRNASLANQVQTILDTYGVRVLSYTEGMHDTAPHSVLMRQLIDSNAQFERASIRLRVRDSLRSAAKRGDWKGGSPPFGYSYASGSKLLTPDSSESVIINKIFTRVADGASAAEVASELRAAGVHGRPSRKIVDSRGSPRITFITATAILGYILNPTYRGIVRVRAAEQDPTARPGKKATWEEFRGRHTPLVSDEDWFRANRMLASQTPSKASRRRRMRDSPLGILQGLLRCASCNAAMSPVTSGRKQGRPKSHRYYRCVYLSKGAEQSGCTTRQVSADAIETALLALIQALEANPASFARAGLDQSNKRRENTIVSLQSDLHHINDKLATEKQTINNLLELVGKSGISALAADAYTQVESARAEINRLEYKRIEVEAELNRLIARIPTLPELSRAFGKVSRALLLASTSRKAEIYRYIVREVRLSRIAPAGDGTVGSQYIRTYRMLVTFLINQIMQFGEPSIQPLTAPTKYSDIQLYTTFEVRSNQKQQRVFLLEHGYSTISCVFKSDSAPPPVAPSELDSNPIQRALRWKTELNSGEVNSTNIATREGVSKGLVSQYLSLLALPQLIVDFLHAGRDRELKMRFTLRELQRLAGLPTAEAVARFHARVAGVPFQQTIQFEGGPPTLT